MGDQAIVTLPRSFIDLPLYFTTHPLCPPPLGREGEEYKRGADAPLNKIFPLPLIREGGQGDRLLNDFPIAAYAPTLLLCLQGYPQGLRQVQPAWLVFHQHVAIASHSEASGVPQPAD